MGGADLNGVGCLTRSATGAARQLAEGVYR
jgi:hypothetical protein